MLQLSAASAEESGFINNRQCFGCHKGQMQTFQDGVHGRAFAKDATKGCQSCHGGGAAHIEVVGDMNYTGPLKIQSFKKTTSTAEDKARPCLECHENKTHSNWRGSQHEMAGVTCSDCHNPHQVGDTVRQDVCYTCHKEKRAQSLRANHMPVKEGKMTCASCHNPHGSTGPKLLVKNTVVETCYQCHAEKRGPFLWEHPPASDDCTICHNPHGSVNASLLKTRPPFLCNQCHIAGGHSTTGIRNGFDLGSGVVPGGSTNGTTTTGVLAGSPNAQPQMVEKSCLSCHIQIHGSNSPSGARWTR